MPHTIMIVDDHAMIRLLLRRCIEAQTEWEVCGEAENGQMAVEMFTQLKPNIVILDFQMPIMDGLQVARQIQKIAPKTPILMLTMHNSEQLRRAAIAVGVKDVLSKSDCVAERLLATLRQMTPAI